MPANEIIPRQLPEPVAEARRAIFTKGFGGARAVVDSLCAAHPDEEDLHGLRALLLLWSGDMEGAWQLANERMRVRPSPAMAGAGAAIAQFMAKESEEAALAAHGSALDADHFLVLRHRADHATIKGDYEEGVANWQRLLELYPEDPDAYSAMVTAYAVAGDPSVQDRLLAEAPSWFVGTAQYHNKRGMLALQRGDMAAAEDELRQAVAICPEGGSYWGHLSLVLRHVAKFDEAEQAATFSLELNSRNPVAMSTLAGVARQRGDAVAASEWEKKASGAVPALQSQAVFKKVNELIRARKPEAAISELKKISKGGSYVTQRTARRMLVRQLVLAERWEEAREHLDLARAAGDHDTSLTTHEFCILDHEHRDEEAARLLGEIRSAPPIPADAYGYAIRFLARLGEDAEIDQLFEELMGALPGPPILLAGSIMELDKAGRQDQASQLCQAALRRFPNEQRLRLLEAALSAGSGNLGAARRSILQMPAHMRPRVSRWGLYKKPQFWIGFFKVLFGRRRRNRK